VATELIFGVAVAAVAVLAIVSRLMPKRMPPSPVFQCTRCGAASRHNDRTANAWRNGKTTFFCQACHARWLQSRSPNERTSSSGHASSGNSGCLGIVALIAFAPLGCLLLRAYA
jgi:hypothetical protein